MQMMLSILVLLNQDMTSPPQPPSRIPLRLTPTRGRSPNLGYGVHTSSARLQNTEPSPPSPPSFGGTRFQSPPELGDLGGIILAVEVND